jgi:PAS domain S-box-containing protein
VLVRASREVRGERLDTELLCGRHLAQTRHGAGNERADPTMDRRDGSEAVRATAVRPTGVERRFGADEIIVSKTDTRGIITYANDVFLRVSMYDEEDLLGKPHNVIRHPDMPRCVFKLLWDTIGGGNELFAYVLNLAADGAHYWVFAHVTPTFSPTGEILGYHSNRRLPAPAAVHEVGTLYKALIAEERKHAHGPDAIAAGVRLLQSTLDDARMSYDNWVWDVTARATGTR